MNLRCIINLSAFSASCESSFADWSSVFAYFDKFDCYTFNFSSKVLILSSGVMSTKCAMRVPTLKISLTRVQPRTYLAIVPLLPCILISSFNFWHLSAFHFHVQHLLFNSSSVFFIVSLSAYNDSLEVLDLSWNMLGADGAMYIADSLKVWLTVQSLNNCRSTLLNDFGII